MARLTPSFLRSGSLLALAALALGGGSFAALAQQKPADSAAAGRAPRIAFADLLTITEPSRESEDAGSIGAISVTGIEEIGAERFQQVIDDFEGEPLTEDALEQLLDELTQIARDEGYPYARAEIDREAAVAGNLSVAIDAGRIDAVSLDGSDDALAQRILGELVGKAARKDTLERALLLVSDIPDLRLRSASLERESQGGSGNVLVVKVSERGDSYGISADNYGSENFGPIRARLSADLRGAFVSGDELRGAVRINPIEPDELLFLSGSYGTALGSGGLRGTISASAGRTQPGDIGGADIVGDTLRIAGQLSMPVKRSRDGSVWIEGALSYVQIEQDVGGDLLRGDTIVTASAGLRTQFAAAGGTARTGVTIERGLGIFGATRLRDPLASRSDGDAVFTKVRFDTDLRVPLAKRVSLLLAAAGQIADRPLLGPDEIALGGPYRTRGYNFAEVLGDEGIYGLAEIRYNVDTGNLPLRYLQLYGFVDGGYVSDIAASGGEGTLFSAGPGVRTKLGPVDFEIEGGFPLGGSGQRGDDPDPQFNLRAGVNF